MNTMNSRQIQADSLHSLSEAERQQVLVEWNATQQSYPQDQCIHQLFEAQVERTPEAVALVFGEQQITYRELNARANQLAHYLQMLGVGPEVLVGLCVERSIEMVVSLLAALKAGGAYVPLDPTYPAQRLAFMLQDSQVAVLLTQEHLQKQLPASQARLVCLDTEWVSITEYNLANAQSDVTAENLAYVIYTSGSTGQPKGVLIEHRGLCNVIHDQSRLFQIQPTDRILQFASFSFDASVSEIFMALTTGAALYLGTLDDLQAGPPLCRFLYEKSITTVTLTPSVLKILPPEELPALRTIISAGEKGLDEIVARWAPNRQFFNAYGPTETSICASVVECNIERHGSIIGRPISNTQLYVLDQYLHPVPVGVPGELYIGGAGVARGYLKRPELTSARFVPNPFSEEINTRLYKTGDLVRYLPDRNLEFLGRLDHQVKIRGFRIELGEIEAVLIQHPAVRDAVVVARTNEAGDNRLVAYLVAAHVPTPLPRELRYYLQARLPNYMLPSAFVLLEVLPLTPNGKVDHRLLPEPQSERTQEGQPFVAPRDSVERTLGEIWTQVLGIEQISVYDNFFDLGGDSLLSVQITARANQLGIRFTPKHLFQHLTIAELARVIIDIQAMQAEQETITGDVPLGPTQRLFFENYILDPHHRNTSVMLAFKDSGDKNTTKKAIEHLLIHHDMLRARYVKDQSGWKQFIVGPEETIGFEYIDLSTSNQDYKKIIETMGAALNASLNLSRGPLLRVAFFDLGSTRPSRLLIIIHHLVIDAFSWEIFLQDLQTAYHQFDRGEPVVLPAKTTSFQYWTQRLTEYAQSAELLKEVNYWSAMQHAQAKIPLDYPNGENTMASGRSFSASLNIEETSMLIHWAPKNYQATVNDMLLTTLTRVFAQWSQNNSLLVLLTGHGREGIFEEVNLSRTIGWFITHYPVLLELEDSENIKSSLHLVSKQLRNIPQQGISYGLLRHLNIREDIVKKMLSIPQPVVGFNYQGYSNLESSENSLFCITSEESGPIHSKRGLRPSGLLIQVFASVIDGKFELTWVYSENVHNRNTIESLAQKYLKSLRLFLRDI